jgi:hypothetical protein
MNYINKMAYLLLSTFNISRLEKYLMINFSSLLNSNTDINTSSYSFYDKYIELFSEQLQSAIEETDSMPSAYSQSSETYNVEKQGSHIVDGIELIPNAPEYNAIAAAPFHQEIANIEAAQATAKSEISATSPLASLVQTIPAPIQQTNLKSAEPVTQQNSSNPPSAYRVRSEPWSLETHGSHIVNGIQLIPGAPGYNAASAAPFHSEIEQINAKYL